MSVPNIYRHGLKIGGLYLYLSISICRSKVILFKSHRPDTQTRTADRLLYLDHKVVSKDVLPLVINSDQKQLPWPFCTTSTMSSRRSCSRLLMSRSTDSAVLPELTIQSVNSARPGFILQLNFSIRFRLYPTRYTCDII